MEERVRSVFESGRESVVEELTDIYRGSSSISSECLAKVMQYILNKIN